PPRLHPAQGGVAGAHRPWRRRLPERPLTATLVVLSFSPCSAAPVGAMFVRSTRTTRQASVPFDGCPHHTAGPPVPPTADTIPNRSHGRCARRGLSWSP